MAEKEIKRVIKIESGQSANTLNNLSARIKELKSSMGDLDIASEEYREVSEDINRLENTKRNAIRGVTAAVDGSYNAYSKELSILQKHRKTLKEGTDEYKEMTKRVAELQDKLKEMDAEVGTHTRNVGNYSSAFSGLQNSVNQVTRELPVLTMGADRFFLAISNNLPILYDNIRAYKAMATEGKTNVSVLGALGKALFSWNTLITVGITLLTQFGGQIVDWVKGLFSAEEQIDHTKEAIQAFYKEIGENGLGIGDEIVKIKELQSAWNALGDEMDAKRKFIEENKKSFEELGIAINNVKDAEKFFIDQTDDYIEALKSRAMAEAAKRQAESYYDKAAALEVLNALDLKKYNALPEYIPKTTVAIGDYQAYNNTTEDVYNPARTELKGAMTTRQKEIDQYYEMGDALFELAKGYEAAGNSKYEFATTGGGKTERYKTPAYKDGNYKRDMLTISDFWGMGNAIDEVASIEANEARIKAYEQMASASAEERIAIEERLNDELAMIEEIRLTEHEILLNEMLRDEELTADERIAIEQQLSEVKVEQMEAQIRAEEERAEKAKEIKDKELEEEKKREEEKEKLQKAMLSSTSALLKNMSGLFEEDSKAHKALNAASIVMDTYAAAMAGWKSGILISPFVAYANVAASIAMGAAQLKNLYKVAEDGSNAMGSLSAPSVASSMPASYTRSLQGDNELTELNKETRVYVVESDITNAQKSARVRVESASF